MNPFDARSYEVVNVRYESQNLLALQGAGSLRQQPDPQTRPDADWQQLERQVNGK